TRRERMNHRFGYPDPSTALMKLDQFEQRIGPFHPQSVSPETHSHCPLPFDTGLYHSNRPSEEGAVPVDDAAAPSMGDKNSRRQMGAEGNRVTPPPSRRHPMQGMEAAAKDRQRKGQQALRPSQHQAGHREQFDITSAHSAGQPGDGIGQEERDQKPEQIK